MKNGNVREFVDQIHYGNELWFLYNGTKYFLEGTPTRYPVEAFLHAPLFDGRTFWEAEQDITWIDD